MKKKVLIVSILVNFIFIVFFLLVANYYKEELIQKYIDKKHSADIVMFGDSHTEGGHWNALIDGYSIKRLGWGGYTSDQLRGLIKMAIEYKPKYVFILCGGNDIGGCCFSIDHTVENMRIMSDSLRKNNIIPVFQKLLYQVNNPQFNVIIDSINTCLFNYCKNEKIDFIDITNGMMDSAGLKKTLTRDGQVHLNKDGYIIWSKWINNFLNNKN